MEPLKKTVAGVFSSLTEAEYAARDLQKLGIPSDNISVIAGNQENRHEKYLAKAKRASLTTAEAATSGASKGGGVGIVATLVALSIPGVGPMVASGALATVLAGLAVGAVGGGVIAALVNMGFSREEASLYEEAVRRDAVILAAHVTAPVENEALAIMKQHGSRDIREQIAAFDPHPYPWDDSVRAAEPPGTIDAPEG
jgi:hypothetical protein